PLRLIGGLVEHAREGSGHAGLLLHPLYGGPRAQRRLGLRAQLRGGGHELLRQFLVEQRQQQVLRVELGVPHPARKLLRGRDGLLALECQLVAVHQRSVALRSWGAFHGTRSRRYWRWTWLIASRISRSIRFSVRR